jgi:hypothetical protein
MDFWLICSSFFEKDTVVYKRRQRKDINAKTNADTGAKTNADTGAKTNADTGAKTNADTGAKTNADTGAKTNAKTNADTGADTGAKTNADTGAKTNADTGADINADTERKEKLQIIFHKLNEIPEFANKYDIYLDKLITTYFVRVMRKEKPIQEKYVYSPSIDIEYRTNRGVCFDIEWETRYKRLIVTPKTIFSQYNDYGHRFGKTEYEKNINFDEIDYDDIVKYITETDLIMSFRKDTTPDCLPSNEWRCSKCNN